ncbi:MAG: cyclohydrolase I/Nitrile oxidoreductase [Bacteroidetes bacterium]|nr:cyclohydrolase I/Nitrile oxidoreductase [Bacteroidota bacterium]
MEFNLNESLLGKKASTPERYDASLLFSIPRSENRIKYDLYDNNLPFTGYDVWNCYEVSFLTDNGLPVAGMLKLAYPAASTYMVESKSLKLYLNSFNMERLGATIEQAQNEFISIVQTDLRNLLQTEAVEAQLFTEGEGSGVVKPFADSEYKTLVELVDTQELLSWKFRHFYETPELLAGTETSVIHTYAFRTDMLRSNCRVTNQPDWGDLFVKMETRYDVDMISVIKYLVSFRKENHFHEEVVEMIYKRFQDKFKPGKLMVAAMYTRRGGIDINPVRSNDLTWIKPAFTDINLRMQKTLRQ